MAKILIVDDSQLNREILSCMLEDKYDICEAENGKQAVEILERCHKDFKLVLLDLIMPVMDGYEMVARIRETDGNTPILFASAMSSPKDVTKGYDIGVDNYVKKPFVPDELDAHIRSLLRMKEGAKSRNETDHCRMGKYLLDTKHANLRNDKTGSIKVLTIREAKIIHLLYENRGETVNRSAILSRFWETEDDYFASRSLDVFMSKIRKYLEDEPCVEIKTVRGVGFMMLLDCI